MKYLLLLTLIIGATNTFAQKTKIAIQGGINLNSINWKDNDPTNTQSDSSDYAFTKTSGKQGFHVNLVVDIHTEENYYFETGIGITKKGGKTDETTTLQPGSVNFKRVQYFSPTYIRVPLYLVYMPEIKKKYKFTAGVGAHIAFGVGGKTEKSTTINGGAIKKQNYKAKFGVNSSDDFKSTDIGVGAKIGFIMSDNISFGASYERSIFNNAPKTIERTNNALFSTIGLSITKYIRR